MAMIGSSDIYSDRYCEHTILIGYGYEQFLPHLIGNFMRTVYKNSKCIPFYSPFQIPRYPDCNGKFQVKILKELRNRTMQHL